MADHLLRQGGKTTEALEDLVDFKYSGRVAVMSLLEAIVTKAGLDMIREKVTRPLTGLRVVCYYGCLMVRPAEVRGFDRVENPEKLDSLMEALGAEVKQWSYKTECCGAGLSLTRSEVVEGLVGRLAEAALAAGADALVTACPLCQSNLEMRQKRAKKMPSFYFTELVGVAMGVAESPGWMSRHINDPKSLIKPYVKY
jgi:heterodisulfide reductase subunit B